MSDRPRDRVLEALADLSGPAPSVAHDARVRARCHAALAGSVGARRPRQSPFDTLLPLAVVVYGVVILWEGIRVVLLR
jgi:hypothetical protein